MKYIKMLTMLLVTTICMMAIIPASAFAADQVRGTILGMDGQPLAYSDPTTGERVYPYGDLASIVLGGVYGADQNVGRGIGGIEESMDTWLYPSIESYSVQLTLDMELQKAAEDALAGLISLNASPEAKGSIVVMDMRGRVLAMASEDKTKQDVAYNNAIARRSAPGELFLMVPALKALETNRLTINETISDAGLYSMYDVDNPPRCWIDLDHIHQHANQTVTLGLMNCCYYFFYTIGSRLGADGEEIQSFAQDIGLTGKTGIELPGETESFAADQSTLYTPGTGQYTRIPALMFEDTCRLIAEYTIEHEISATTQALQDCVERMRNMAYEKDQGYEHEIWRDYVAANLEAIGFSTEQATDPALMDQILAQLDRIKYGGSKMLEAAIGQSITQVTPIAMARYLAAIANGGDIYPASIVEGIMLGDDWIDRAVERMPINSLPDNLTLYLPYIREGMHGAIDINNSLDTKNFRDWKYLTEIGSMKAYGKDCETGDINSVWYAGFAPYDDPEIVVVVNLLDGCADEDYVATAGQKVFESYLDSVSK